MYLTTNFIALRHVYGIQLTNTIRVGWVLNKRSRVESASNFRSHAWSSFCSRDGWLARRGEGTRVCLTHPIQCQYHVIPFSYWISVHTMQYHSKPSNTIHNHAILFNTMQYHWLPCPRVCLTPPPNPTSGNWANQLELNGGWNSKRVGTELALNTRNTLNKNTEDASNQQEMPNPYFPNCVSWGENPELEENTAHHHWICEDMY